MQRVSPGFSGEWADLLGNVETAVKGSTLPLENYGDGTHNSGYLFRYFRHDNDDELQLEFQLNHDVLVPGECRFHLHLRPMSLPVAGVSDVVRWQYYYFLNAVGGELPRNIASWTTSTVSRTIATTDQYKHVVHSIVTVNLPAGLSASSQLFMRIIRAGSSDAADTYNVDKATSGGGLTASANLAVTGIDCHVQRSRAGTQGEFS